MRIASRVRSHPTTMTFFMNGGTARVSRITSGTPLEGNNSAMVLCVVDDLLFSVKISTAAKALRVETYFERTAAMVLPRVREKQPSLVVFDLDSVTLRPLDAIAALKSDPALQRVPTLGFVSHVRADVIAAARQAGIDDVLPRSAFTQQLGEILTRGATPDTNA